MPGPHAHWHMHQHNAQVWLFMASHPLGYHTGNGSVREYKEKQRIITQVAETMLIRLLITEDKENIHTRKCFFLSKRPCAEFVKPYFGSLP